MLVELSVMEQRYQAVLAVVQDGWKVTEVADRLGVSRQSVHAWIARYEQGGLAALVDHSHRPSTCPHELSAELQARICELRREHPGWGPRRICHQLGRERIDPVPGRSSIYRCLKRHGLIELRRRRKRREEFRRWERERPKQLWQMDVMGKVWLEGGTELKVVTGIDDHSRFCVAAGVVRRATSKAVCQVLAASLARYGIPDEVLTDNGKCFTGRFGPHPTEVLFDRILRENGISHRHTGVRSPTTTGKIERFHRTLREELLSTRTFASIAEVQGALDHYVATYNTLRPHQALGMATPIERFSLAGPQAAPLTGALEDVQDGEVITDQKHDHIRRVDVNGRIHFGGARYYAATGLARDSVTVRVVDDEVRIHYRGELLRSHRRRHPKEKEEVIWSHHRRQSNRTVP